MCGRYQFTAEQCEEIRQIAETIPRKYGKECWSPGEIRPSNHAPVLVAASNSPVPQLMKRGNQLPNSLVINTRAETADEKPLVKIAVIDTGIDAIHSDLCGAIIDEFSINSTPKAEPTDFEHSYIAAVASNDKEA